MAAGERCSAAAASVRSLCEIPQMLRLEAKRLHLDLLLVLDIATNTWLMFKIGGQERPACCWRVCSQRFGEVTNIHADHDGYQQVQI
jgi:hypothetical protein